jgi:hypothetical protein
MDFGSKFGTFGSTFGVNLSQLCEAASRRATVALLPSAPSWSKRVLATALLATSSTQKFFLRRIVL